MLALFCSWQFYAAEQPGTGLIVGHETGDFSVDVVVFLKDLVLVIKQKAAASLLCSLPPCWFNLK